jgi:hypothetical protein
MYKLEKIMSEVGQHFNDLSERIKAGWKDQALINFCQHRGITPELLIACSDLRVFKWAMGGGHIKQKIIDSIFEEIVLRACNRTPNKLVEKDEEIIKYISSFVSEDVFNEHLLNWKEKNAYAQKERKRLVKKSLKANARRSVDIEELTKLNNYERRYNILRKVARDRKKLKELKHD